VNKPIIGITPCIFNHWTAQEKRQTRTIGCSLSNTESILRSGGSPILLPYTRDTDTIRSAMESIHGLYLSGGGDIVSLRYGEEPHPKSSNQDPIRDDMDISAVSMALEMNMPIFCICRGIQVLNVALGGTVIQDIHSENPDSILHFANASANALVHTIDIESGTLLEQIFKSSSIEVNSWHHQAIGTLGKGLTISARARDGIIEGLESTEGLPVLAVQFHPEASSKDFPIFQKLFDWIVSEAQAYQAR